MIGVRLHDLEDAFTVFAVPFGTYIDIDRGISCSVSSWRRTDDNAIPARAKITGSYVNAALAKTEAQEAGFDEAIVLTQDGHVSEGSAENLFLVPDRTKIRDFAASVFYDPQVKAEGASIEVRNTGGRAGMAQSIADRLAERSYAVSIVTNGATARSAVLVRNGAKRYTANTLAAQLGGIPVDTLPSGESSADIVVRVGSDFRGLATDLAR